MVCHRSTVAACHHVFMADKINYEHAKEMSQFASTKTDSQGVCVHFSVFPKRNLFVTFCLLHCMMQNSRLEGLLRIIQR